MPKPFFRLLALGILCALLVYAPELYTAVSVPYALAHAERILLRAVLCTEDAAAADVFYDTLPIYMKQFPAVHLRIVRTDPESLFSLPDPQPDLFIFPADLAYPSDFFHPTAADSQAIYLLCTGSGRNTPLACGIHHLSRHQDAAAGLILLLRTTFSTFSFGD